ncbi:hypothetical protein PTTG_25984 [Puccinia triticina 1-1 BBBD Race 1]|uniref:Uncharacterized protein n=1 Tax=Puccinia triticina (isolate 1-1 / race 1 (BBBD)) TaxID=630390 RepID=A0A180GXS0_PUCT1|nr:hypothetical protein PTTG_25984 [Puccinia triticina 1-1 BBBD Race 1]
MADPNPPAQETGEMSIADCFKALMAIQKTTALQLQTVQQQAEKAQARADKQRRSDREQTKALEKAILSLSIKREASISPLAPADDCIDLAKFRTSDGPRFKGPIQEAELFLTWMRSVSIFFLTKGIKHSDDKILVLGSLIDDTILLAFYESESPKFIGKTWDEFKSRLFGFCLPEDWRADVCQLIVRLEMPNTKSFQDLINFDMIIFNDFSIAEFVVLGLPHALRVKVKDFQLLKQKPFNYGDFKSRTNGFYADLPKTRQPSYRSVATGANATPLGSNRLEPDLYLWRMHAYLDSVGKCHFCKKHCGNPAGACPAPPDRSKVYIPPAFQVPLKPANYVAPRAWSSAHQKQPGPTTAGRPTGKPAGVAGMDEAPPFEQSQVSLISAIDGQLKATALAYGDHPLSEIKKEDQLAPKSDNGSYLLPEEPSDTSDLIDVHAVNNEVESILDKWFLVDNDGTTEYVPISTAHPSHSPTRRLHEFHAG